MGRLIIWLMVILLAAGGAYAASTARYEYFTDQTTQARKDRWTGAVQVWGCIAWGVRGTESAYYPMAPDSGDRPCTRYGWMTRK